MNRDVDAELLNILVCPESRAPLVRCGNWLYSTDPSTRRRYEVRDGIPIMLAEESKVVDQDEFERVMADAEQTARPAPSVRSEGPGAIPVVK